MQSRSHHCSLRIPRVLYGMDGMYIPKKSSPFISFLRSIISGQIIATSHDLTPNGGLVREIPLFQGKLGWWNIIIWPDHIYCDEMVHVDAVSWFSGARDWHWQAEKLLLPKKRRAVSVFGSVEVLCPWFWKIIPVKGVEFLWIKGATECNNCILVYMARKKNKFLCHY